VTMLLIDRKDATIIHNARASQQSSSTVHVNPPLKSSSSSTVNHDAHWQRPALDRLKCNIDASFSQSLNHIGIGICVRDGEGAFVLVKMVSFSPLCEVPVGEALRLYNAIEWLSDMHNG